METLVSSSTLALKTMMTLQPWVLGGEQHLGVEESVPYPEGRVLCRVGDLDVEHREHRSFLEVVSIQLQKPALKEQVKTEADATEGKGNKHNVWSLGRDNEHVVLL